MSPPAWGTPPTFPGINPYQGIKHLSYRLITVKPIFPGKMKGYKFLLQKYDS